MKNIFAALLALTTVKFISAQFPYNISGKISNSKTGYIVFTTLGKYFIGQKADTVTLKKDGSFNYHESFDAPTTKMELQITPDEKFMIWCAANETLTITIKDSASKPIFAGSLGKINKYTLIGKNYWEKIFKAYEQKTPDLQKDDFLRSDKYFRITDSITLDRISFLKKYFANTNTKVEQRYISEEEKELLYRDLFFKISYNDPPLEKLKFYQTRFNAKSKVIYKFSDQITFNNPHLLNTYYFLQFSRMFLMELVFIFQKENNIKLTKEQFYEKLFSFIDYLSNNKLCNAILKASFMNDEVNNMVLNEKSTPFTYSRFVDSLQTYRSIKKYAKIIEANFINQLSQLNALKKGTLAPSCLLTDTTGQISSLENFKGKLIYIDVWASWCGKCIDAMPDWNKLVDKYKDDSSVAFITISTDKQAAKGEWLKILRDKKLKGFHFISYGDEASELAKNFNVNTWPTNILIDKDGRIIDIKAARPDVMDLSSYLK